MRFGVLGPIAAWTDEGRPVPIPGAKVRTLLADLVVHRGEPVAADRLVDDLWGESPDSANPAGLLSSKVSQLRRALDGAEPGARALVVSPPPGYTLAVDAAAVDADEFTALVDEAAEAGDTARAIDLLERALALWRGPAYGEVADLRFARGAVARLDERRLTALEALARARLAQGEHARVADELTALVEAHPWREELRLSHVLALYRAGRQPDALASYESYRRHLRDELGIDPSAAAADLHRAVLVQDADLAAPTAAREAPVAPPGGPPAEPPAHRPPSNLPAPRSELIGRDDDLDGLVAALASGGLVSLVGPGGVGKTTLALAAARGAAPDRRDGAWFVDLSGVERGAGSAAASSCSSAAADLVADAVAATLAIREVVDAPAPASSVDRLAAALRGHEVLLVLDNCEHVVDAAAEVADRVLRDAPGVTLLATGREALGVPGEVVRTVGPLGVPDPRDQGRPDLVARADAVRLFVSRVEAAGATVAVDGWTSPLIGTLCRRLDGLPLALELAATRVPALGLSEVVARLGDRFRLLGAGRRGGPDRHRTLEAMLDWSWELLGADEQQVLRRLAVHADGCTPAAAAAVGATDDATGTADVLGRLAQHSLVVADHRAAGTRYRLLESVAAYAADRLAEAGETDEVRRRHLAWYVALAEQADGALRGHGQAHWLTVLDAESANVRAALDTATELEVPDAAHRLVAALGWYWVLRGRTATATRMLDRALAVPAGASDVPTPAWARAVAFRTAAGVAQGDLVDHARRMAAALDAFTALDAPVDRGRAAMLLGSTANEVGLVDDGERLLDEALVVAVAEGDVWGEGAALIGLALTAHMRGDLARLEAVATRADGLFAEVGDGWGRLAAGEWLGALAELVGDLDRAEKLLREGIHEAERLGLWRAVASRLGLLGWVARQRGDWATAQALGEQTGRLAVEQADRSLGTLAGMVLAFTARRTGDLDGAEAQLRALLEESGVDVDAIVDRSSDAGAGSTGPSLAPHVATIAAELGHVAELRGDPPLALALHRRVLADSLASGYQRDAIGALEGAAAALSALGDHPTAARLLGAAAAARSGAQLAAAVAEQDDVDRALGRVSEALGTNEVDRLLAEGRALTPAAAAALLG